ncbi:hypothetical protein FQN49_008030 [Arthroderma sp. PD_2]|nr:hypothetical protein FQN49_008030 [Arthroderma sp. PD_2]
MSNIYNSIREFITTEIFPSAEETERRRRTYEETREANLNASHVDDMLWKFRRKVEDLYPYRTDIIAIVDKLEQCLRDEHGGLLPLEFFVKFGDVYSPQVLTPQEEKILGKRIERWSNATEVSKEFAFLRSYTSSGKRISRTEEMDGIRRASAYDTEENACKTADAMQKWMQDRYGTVP